MQILYNGDNEGRKEGYDDLREEFKKGEKEKKSGESKEKEEKYMERAKGINASLRMRK